MLTCTIQQIDAYAAAMQPSAELTQPEILKITMRVMQTYADQVRHIFVASTATAQTCLALT